MPVVSRTLALCAALSLAAGCFVTPDAFDERRAFLRDDDGKA